ncbi:MAG: divergent polysaccharide deacetylase family protein [Pseudomonadota bacterium]
MLHINRPPAHGRGSGLVLNNLILPLAAALTFIMCVITLTVHAQDADAPAIVLIIDDLGNNQEASLRTVGLYGELTLGILPHTPYAGHIAKLATDAGKEVIVHVPMSSIHGVNTGPGGLNERQSEQYFVEVLTDNLGAVPFARGVNNHMGSSLTQNDSMMQLLMSVIAQRELYFIDSRTSAKTVAATMAGRHNIKHLSRDVFLDNTPTVDHIHGQFQRLLRVARKHGIAVAIGHPHVATLDYLESVLPTLEALEKVRLISGSKAIDLRYPQVDIADRRLAEPFAFR